MADNTNTNPNNNNLDKQSGTSDISVEIIEGVSKAGNAYKCLEIQVGDLYKARVFPTPVEIAYIEHIIG